MHAYYCFNRKRINRTILLVLFLLFLGLLDSMGPDSSHASKPSLYAVIVGISDYKDSSIPDLKLSAKDAQDFSEMLRSQSGEFKETRIKLLVNEEATRDAVTEAMREELRHAGKDDVVIIYLSGHGAADPTMPNEFYYLAYDSRASNLFGTAVLMNDTKLYRGIDSDRVLMITDACNSGGFGEGLVKMRAKAAGQFLNIFNRLEGRAVITSSKPDELSWEDPMHENSIFTHYVLKGLRGSADNPTDGIITLKELYDFVYDHTKKSTKGLQHPQLFKAKSHDASTPVFKIPTYDGPLNIDVQFKYLDDNNNVKRLTNESVLKDGQGVGVAFKPNSDCYVHIFWWDSSGNLGRLFPNPNLTDGDGKVEGGKTYWLPSREGEGSEHRWFELDSNPGTETLYFVASRSKNEQLTKLYSQMVRLVESGAGNQQKVAIAKKIDREISLMGFTNRTRIKGSAAKPSRGGEEFSSELADKIKIMGPDAMFSIKFRHISK